MKKTKLLLALCLSGYFGFAQTINTIAGNGTAGYSGDGGQATAAELYGPYGIALDAAGNTYIADGTHRIRKINTSGVISTIAGNGTSGYTGNGGQATAAELVSIVDIDVDANSNIYLVDFNVKCVRKINTSGIISNFAGIGNGTGGFSGDGGQATAAKLFDPYGIAIDAGGNVYIADVNNYRVRKINTSGIISTYAGNGLGGYTGDGGQATAAKIEPYSLAIDAAGNLYVGCTTGHVRKINTSGIITTVAGNGTGGYSGDGGQATSAGISLPTALEIDNSGSLYISDENNNVVRKVNTSGIISTVVGNGTAGFSGDGGSPLSAELHLPTGLAIDANSNLYVSDGSNSRIRRVSAVTLPWCDASIESISLTNYTACSGITIPTTSVSGFNYTWAPTTALSCTNCIQPFCTYSNTSTPIIYTVTVGAENCSSVTATVQVTAVTQTITANAGSNVIDYDNGSGSVCSTMSIGTTSVSGVSYAWSPTTALSCTNCAQPNTSYDNIATPIIYTVTVTGTGCATATSTVQVTTHATPSLTTHMPSTTSINGQNITAHCTWSGNTTPNNYYLEVTQVDQYGTVISGGYSWPGNGWYAGAPSTSNTFTFTGTSTLTCNTYYRITYAVQNTNACIGWVATSTFVYTTLDPYFMLSSTKINSTTYTVSATYPTDNPTGSSGFGYYWDVVETDAGGTPISGTEIVNPSCWWTYPTANTFNGYNSTSTLGSCSSVGQFMSGDYYHITYGVWSDACAWTQYTLQMALCGGACRTAQNPEGVLISPGLDAPDQSGYLQTGIINNIPADVLHIYPNPNNGTFFIEGNTDAGQLLQVYDVNGRLVLSQKIQGRTSINAGSLPDGVYNISISGNNTINNKKLVIVK